MIERKTLTQGQIELLKNKYTNTPIRSGLKFFLLFLLAMVMLYINSGFQFNMRIVAVFIFLFILYSFPFVNIFKKIKCANKIVQDGSYSSYIGTVTEKYSHYSRGMHYYLRIEGLDRPVKVNDKKEYVNIHEGDVVAFYQLDENSERYFLECYTYIPFV